MNWTSRLRTAFTDPPDEDVLEELAQHAAATYASARAEGCDVAEAERRVDLEIAAWAAKPALLRRRPKREPAGIAPPGTARPPPPIPPDARHAWPLVRKQPPAPTL